MYYDTAADEEAARKQLKTATEKWSGQYPSTMNRWHDNWDAISPIFKFSQEVRTALYTTNAMLSSSGKPDRYPLNNPDLPDHP